MARITDQCIERVRDAVDFVDLVSARTELRRAGPTSLEGLCPFHDERTPSFSVQPVDKLYYCFGCQASGDLFTYVQDSEGVDFREAVELLASRYGVELEFDGEDPREADRRARRARLLGLLARASTHYERQLWEGSEAADSRLYLTERGLGEEILHRFRVGYAPRAWDTIVRVARTAGFTDRELLEVGLARNEPDHNRVSDRFVGRIMFPLADARGRVLGFGARATRTDQRPKYLNSPDGELYHKGRHLYGTELARSHTGRAGQVVVCEGYTDVLALHQAGVPWTVGLMGTAMTEVQLGELSRLSRTVLLCLDADSAGEDAIVRAAQIASHRGIELRVVPLPAGSDPAALAQTGGSEAIHHALGASVPLVRFLVLRILAAGEHGSGEGRDRTLARLRPLFGTLAPSATREELAQTVAARLNLSPGLLAQLLEQHPNTAPDGGRRTGAVVALNREEETERAFLALCIALPSQATPLLAELDLSEHFTSQAMRQAARHLRERGLEAPLADAATLAGDEPLARTLAGLMVQAERAAATHARLEAQHQQLRLAATERQLRAARADGAGSIAELAHRRAAAKRAFDAAYARAVEEDG
jgi:DNA primase